MQHLQVNTHKVAYIFGESTLQICKIVSFKEVPRTHLVGVLYHVKIT